METMIAMLYSEGVRTNRITLERLAVVMSGKPARIFGLYPRRGAIAAGADADLCILDPAQTRSVTASTEHSAGDFDVFEGWEVTGWPVTTALRGQVVYADGRVTSEPGHGQLVKGSASTDRPGPRAADPGP
jgi:dihydropyrimidinase